MTNTLPDKYLIAEITSVLDDGFLLLHSYSDFPGRFLNLTEVFVCVFGGYRKFFIDNVEESNESVIIRFKNFFSKKDAQFLAGCKVYVNENDAVIPDEGIYFIHDLLGCEVYIKDKFFGKLIDIYQLSTNDVYIIEKPDNKQVLIPAVKDYIENFNQQLKKLYLKEADYSEDDEN